MSIDTIAQSTEASKSFRIDSELYRLRNSKSIENFTYDSSVIYRELSFKGVMRYHPEIFTSYPLWSLAQMLDYAFNGAVTDMKRKFVDQAQNIADTDVQEYIRKKEEGRAIEEQGKPSTLLKPVNHASEVNRENMTHDLYVAQETIGEITGWSINHVRSFSNLPGVDSISCGPYNRKALNLATLIPALAKMPEINGATVVLWNYYAELINDLTRNG